MRAALGVSPVETEVLKDILELHTRFGSHCYGCDDTWPCRTIKILAAAAPLATAGEESDGR